MNALDLAILLLALVILVRSYLKGFVKEVASLGGLVLAVLVGIRFMGAAGTTLAEAFGPSPFLPAIGFVILFFAALFIVTWLGAVLSKAILKSQPLSNVDRLLGLMFGVLKAGLVIVVGVFILAQVVGPNNAILTKSRLAPYALGAADWGKERLPESFSKSLKEKKALLDPAAPTDRKSTEKSI